jgi:hypothetical protein
VKTALCKAIQAHFTEHSAGSAPLVFCISFSRWKRTFSGNNRDTAIAADVTVRLQQPVSWATQVALTQLCTIVCSVLGLVPLP